MFTFRYWFFFFSLHQQDPTKKSRNIKKGSRPISTLLSALGELLKSDRLASPVCVVSQTGVPCDVGTPSCQQSIFTMSVSGPDCNVSLFFQNETRAVTGGARGTFTWKLTSTDPINMPSFIQSVDVTGTQEYKNSGTEAVGKVKLEGFVVTTDKTNTESNRFFFGIDGRDDFSTANQNTIGHSDIKLVIGGDQIVDGTRTPFRVVLNEIAGFNINHNTQTLNYFLDNKPIGLNQFKTFSELGITFFFKSTAASSSKPWLGYVGPIKDFLRIPSDL